MKVFTYVRTYAHAYTRTYVRTQRASFGFYPCTLAGCDLYPLLEPISRLQGYSKISLQYPCSILAVAIL